MLVFYNPGFRNASTAAYTPLIVNSGLSIFIGSGTVLTSYLNGTLLTSTAITTLSAASTVLVSGGLTSALLPTAPVAIASVISYPSWTADVPPGMV